jgi:two-component system phosphate regulon sensor histidine kinase PhoR
MPKSWQKYLTGIVLLLGTGMAIGWIYDYPDRGLLIAALAVLAWQIRQLLSFERVLRSEEFDQIPYGDSIWAQMLSRYSHLKDRNRLHKRRYRSLLKEVRKSANALPDGGIVLNELHEVVLCNKAAKALVGFKPRKDRGQRVDNILRDPVFKKYLDSGDSGEGVEIRSPLHENHWLFCRLVPYGANQQLLLIRDITEAKRLATMRREFAANASHELRSPLTVINGYLDSIAEDPELPAHWRKPVEQMQQQAMRMNSIVAELLELSRLESSESVTEAQVIDVCGLLAVARKAYADREGIATIDVELQSRVQLLGSNVEIESVIANLLSNAVRHTPADGNILLRWSSGADGATLAVIDDGEGMSEEHIPRITERFFRVDPGRSRDDGGIGLGLAIVKHVLGRHDARLEIRSQIGKGSEFLCHFPPDRMVDDSVVQQFVTEM